MPEPEIQEESSSSSDPVEGQFPGASIVVSDFSLRDAPGESCGFNTSVFTQVELTRVNCHVSRNHQNGPRCSSMGP